MKDRQLLMSILTVGLALGTAWAIRGRFGHEQGAAWAGAIGALCVILVSKRKDWHEKAFRITLAAAFGWGISGVMSYGVIVGYGRGTDFPNVFYGLLMLFVLGLLYGFLGGGLFGLSLMDSKNNKVPWASVLTEMIAIALLTYGVLINQLQWLMTPPRSEMWAACLGASIALAWYLIRQGYHSVMTVALCAALGAGFGFAFGNFLQVLGNVSGIAFNFWNVMEYSIGFFGGVGMAYGTFTSSWPVIDERPARHGNLIPILFVALLVPFIVWDQTFVTDRFGFILEAGGSQATIFCFKLMAIAAIITAAAIVLYRNYSGSFARDPIGVVRGFFICHVALYIFLSFLVTGIFIHPVEQYLYVLNFMVILFLVPRVPGSFSVYEFNPRSWAAVALLTIGLIAVFALIAINSHEGMHGGNVRFGNK